MPFYFSSWCLLGGLAQSYVRYKWKCVLCSWAGVGAAWFSRGWWEEWVLGVNTLHRMIGSLRRSPIPPAAQSYKIRLYLRKTPRVGMAQPLSNLLHCLTSHGEKVFWVFILSCSCLSLCLYLSSSHQAPLWRAHLSSSYPAPGCQQADWWWDTPRPSLAWLCRCSQFPLMKYNRRSKRVCENTSLDDFQSHKTVEIISLLLKSCENFRSGAPKAPSTWESKAALSLSWVPWSGSVKKNLQALFFWYLDFLLLKDLYTVHLKNVIHSFPFFPSHVSITPDTMTQTGYPSGSFSTQETLGEVQVNTYICPCRNLPELVHQ